MSNEFQDELKGALKLELYIFYIVVYLKFLLIYT